MAPRSGSPDVAVVGGGPAGAAVAAVARSHGLEVMLLDAGSAGRGRPGESLPPGTAELVEEVFGEGAIPPAARRTAHGNRAAWGGPEAVDAEFVFNPFGDGAHVEQPALERGLRAALRERGVRVVEGTTLSKLTRVGGGWELELRPGDPRGAAARGGVAASDTGRANGSGVVSTCEATAVVDAGGRAAPVARSQGARRTRLDRLVAQFALFDRPAGEDPETATLVEAVESGWWYTTPLPGSRRIVALLTDADLLAPRGRRAAGGWSARLADAPRVHEAVAGRGYSLRAGPVSTDASTSHLDRLAGPGWLAVGDAAACFDPLSSQGVLTALLMGREAGNALAAMLRQGDPKPLARYADDYASVLNEHLAQSAACYAREERWREAPFWQRRGATRDTPGRWHPPTQTARPPPS